jgi:endosialidase-like protein
LQAPDVISYDSFMKTITLTLKNSMNASSLPAFLLLPFVLACFALAPATDAQCPQICDGAFRNTAVGDRALINNTTGSDNAAFGDFALWLNTTGSDNAAIGDQVLTSNTTGYFNNAFGHFALAFNTTGYENTAIGAYALESNKTGYRNTAIGHAALASGTGNDNTANGVNALVSNATGNNNVAIGIAALEKKTTGSRNIALGSGAGRNLNIGDDNIHIGNQGLPRESNVIRIGTVGTQTNTFIAGISGVTVAGGVAVVIDANGQLGTSTSSARFKEAIMPMDKASETLFSLKPVRFRYKKELDPAGTSQLGLVAEDVEKVDPDLVARDKEGKPYSVRYDQVNAMLLNEFLKEHRKVEEQAATIREVKSAAANREARITRLESTLAEQQKQIASLVKNLKLHAAEVGKVSARLEAERSAPRLIADD